LDGKLWILLCSMMFRWDHSLQTVSLSPHCSYSKPAHKWIVTIKNRCKSFDVHLMWCSFPNTVTFLIYLKSRLFQFWLSNTSFNKMAAKNDHFQLPSCFNHLKGRHKWSSIQTFSRKLTIQLRHIWTIREMNKSSLLKFTVVLSYVLTSVTKSTISSNSRWVTLIVNIP
jgi:hypothetical protein